MGRLFGTDGARGIANAQLTCELATNIGRAAAFVLTEKTTEKPKVLIGKDTRVSSNMLEMALAAGLCSVGADVVLVGFVPTPAIAFLVNDRQADAGIMISASHNPCEYNGIKIFDGNGYKLPDSLEEKIEALVLDDMSPIEFPTGGEVGSVFMRYDYVDLYIDHLVKSVNADLSGLKIAIDCANGCASYTAEKLFKRLGAQVYMMHDSPNGININHHCGSTNMEDLIDYVNGHDVDLGLAFDGDSDRCLAVDENGKLIDGDRMIAVFALDLKAKGKLNDNTAVVTVMTNLGFKHFAKANDINVLETKVGDRYVLEEMVKNDYVIGGEQSGHIIFKNFATTGDGQLSGAMLASVLASTGKPASEIASVMTVLPQTMVNIKASNELKSKLGTDEDIIKAIKDVEKALGESGRILVRASGTEPLIRVMLEGENIAEIKRLAKQVAKVIEDKA
ncbi:MAG: phosphoglucosamine mutase [Clostridia bacterium]|nr:phosphoglucosamine mutase [Clostridia bacterium]